MSFAWIQSQSKAQAKLNEPDQKTKDEKKP